MSQFSDEMLAKWEYALQNIWTIKFDRNEVEALLRRLRAGEDLIGIPIGSTSWKERYETYRRSKGEIS